MSIEAGRRRYRNKYGKTAKARFDGAKNTAFNRGALRAAAHNGDVAAREQLTEWENEARTDESPNVEFGPASGSGDAA